jgi:hypothetical protein
VDVAVVRPREVAAGRKALARIRGFSRGGRELVIGATEQAHDALPCHPSAKVSTQEVVEHLSARALELAVVRQPLGAIERPRLEVLSMVASGNDGHAQRRDYE